MYNLDNQISKHINKYYCSGNRIYTVALERCTRATASEIIQSLDKLVAEENPVVKPSFDLECDACWYVIDSSDNSSDFTQTVCDRCDTELFDLDKCIHKVYIKI